MLLSQPHLAEGDSPFVADLQRLDKLPEAAAAELRKYLADLLDGKEPGDRGCIWLDHQTSQNRYYEHRPGLRNELGWVPPMAKAVWSRNKLARYDRETTDDRSSAIPASLGLTVK